MLTGSASGILRHLSARMSGGECPDFAGDGSVEFFLLFLLESAIVGTGVVWFENGVEKDRDETFIKFGFF